MSLVRFDPFRDLAILQDRVNRADGPWTPPVDIFETDSKAIVLKAEIPDVSKEDISLKVENNTLTLSGKKQAEKEVKERQYRRIERTFGSFARTFTLPATVDTGRIAAEYKNGVLTVTLPLREDAKPKQIDVAVH
jgi:HSP20 family protein